MKRIGTAQSPYELSRALAETTGGEVTSLSLGRTRPIEGVENGWKRQMTARVDGERRSFLAVEVGGRVHIVDGRFDQEKNKLHEFLKKVDERREQRLKASGKETSTKNQAASSDGTALTKPQALAIGRTDAKATPAPQTQKANGWPTRNSTQPNASQAHIVKRRR